MRSMWLMMMIVALALTAGIQTVSAEEPAPLTPFMFNFFNPAQVPSEDYGSSEPPQTGGDDIPF